jgi:hypothetical protein
MIEALLSFLVAGVATAIALRVLGAYVANRRPHHLFWAIGLGLWALSALGQGYALLWGWPVDLYRAYYFSAIALAGFLGAGTLGLITGRRRLLAIYTTYIIVLAAILAVGVATAPVDVEALKRVVVGGLALPRSVRLLAPLINIPGGIAFIGGAAYSYVKTRRPYALLITLGALTPALGGIMARFEVPGLLPFTDFLGILFLAVGVYLSLKAPR